MVAREYHETYQIELGLPALKAASEAQHDYANSIRMSAVQNLMRSGKIYFDHQSRYKFTRERMVDYIKDHGAPLWEVDKSWEWLDGDDKVRYLCDCPKFKHQTYNDFLDELMPKPKEISKRMRSFMGV